MAKSDPLTPVLEISEGKSVMHTRTLSILLKLSGTHGVVVGEDLLAEIWARYAASQEAGVKLYHPRPSEAFLKEQSILKIVEVISDPLQDENLDGCDWLIVSLSDFKRCETLSRTAARCRVPHAFLHFPELGSLIVPRVFDMESVQIVLPLSSTDPPVEEALSEHFHQLLPAEYGRAVQLLTSVERRLKEQVKDRRHQARVFDTLLNSHFSRLIHAGRWDAAETLAGKVLESYRQDPERRQRVSPRIGVQLPVRFKFEGRPRPGKIFNLSRDGAFVAIRETVPKLTHLTEIGFTLPTGETIANAEGFVVWENSPFKPIAPLYPPGFALMFDSLPKESLEAIERYVQSQLK